MNGRGPVLLGGAAVLLLVLGFVVGGACFVIHGLGYLAAFPFWVLSALCGLAGAVATGWKGAP